jgi:hypothetical protein
MFSSLARKAGYTTLLELMLMGKKHAEMRVDSTLLKWSSSDYL